MREIGFRLKFVFLWIIACQRFQTKALDHIGGISSVNFFRHKNAPLRCFPKFQVSATSVLHFLTYFNEDDFYLDRNQLWICSLNFRGGKVLSIVKVELFDGRKSIEAVINTTLEAMFRDCMQNAFRPVRQIRIAMFNLERLDTQPTLWGKTDAERWGALDESAEQLTEQLGKNVLMTGSQLALRKREAAHITPKAKCPFTPQREMVLNLWGETRLEPLAGLFRIVFSTTETTS